MKLRSLFIALVFFFSCNQPENLKNVTEEKKPQPAETSLEENFVAGKIYNRVVCKSNSEINYALYLPAGYAAGKQYPLILFFDPHAAGDLPLEKYKKLADDFNFILAGSNNSKNGLSFNEGLDFFKVMLSDLLSRFAINNGRIYAAGFSGGAKVASYIAFVNANIAGVIANSGGSAMRDLPANPKLNLFFTVGKNDFNLNEVTTIDQHFEKTGNRHQLISFDGKHEWAPGEIMQKAFYWIELNAMRDKIIPMNDSLIDTFIRIETAAADGKKKDKFEEYYSLKTIINYIDGLRNANELKNKLALLEKDEQLKKSFAQYAQVLQKEKDLKQYYLQTLNVQSIDWWKNETAKLNLQSEKDPSPFVRAMNKRLLGFLSLACYMQANQEIEQNKNADAEKSVQLYQTIDPTNSEAWYMQAILDARNNENGKALLMLKKSVKLGFTEFERMKNQPEFAALKNDEAFVGLVAGKGEKE